MATRALNAALTEALEDGVDYDDLMNVRMDDGGQVSLLSANTMRMNALAERAGDAALRKLETVSAQKVDAGGQRAAHPDFHRARRLGADRFRNGI